MKKDQDPNIDMSESVLTVIARGVANDGKSELELKEIALKAIEDDDTATIMQLLPLSNFTKESIGNLLEIATKKMAENAEKDNDQHTPLYKSWAAVSRYLIFKRKIVTTQVALENLCNAGSHIHFAGAIKHYPELPNVETFIKLAVDSANLNIIIPLLETETTGKISPDTAEKLTYCFTHDLIDPKLIWHNKKAITLFSRMVVAYAESLKVDSESAKSSNHKKNWALLLGMQKTLVECKRITQNNGDACWDALAKEVGAILEKDGAEWTKSLMADCEIDTLKLIGFAVVEKVGKVSSTFYSRIFYRGAEAVHQNRISDVESLRTALNGSGKDEADRKDLIANIQNTLAHDYSDSADLWGSLYKRISQFQQVSIEIQDQAAVSEFSPK